mgnify:CR=1 FL=1
MNNRNFLYVKALMYFLCEQKNKSVLKPRLTFSSIGIESEDIY